MDDPAGPPLRLAEVAGVLSLATDLAMGQPLEHGLRTAMLALRTAQAMELPEEDQVTVFYTGAACSASIVCGQGQGCCVAMSASCLRCPRSRRRSRR
jgi:hypothetical protein